MHRGQEPGHCRRRPLTLARLKACEPPRALTAGAADTQRAVLFGVLTAGATNIAQAGLNLGHSGSASGPSKAVAGAARQTVPAVPGTVVQPTEGQRAGDARTRRLGTRG